MEPRSPDLITVDELARRLDMARKTVTRALERGELPGTRIGRQWRTSWSAVVAQCSQPHRAGTDPAASWPDVNGVLIGEAGHHIGGGGRGRRGPNSMVRDHGTDSGESVRRRRNANGAEKGFLRAALVSWEQDSSALER